MNVSLTGLGHLGASTAAAMASRGIGVIGVDINAEVVERVNAMPDRPAGLWATTNVWKARDAEIAFILVDTPTLPGQRRFSAANVHEALTALAPVVAESGRPGLIVVMSTLFPGDSRRLIRAFEAASGLKHGQGWRYCYNPELVALGTVAENFLNPDVLVIGSDDPEAGGQLEDFYVTNLGIAEDRIVHMSIESAEVWKLWHNNFLIAPIAMTNLLAEACEVTQGASAAEVMRAIRMDRRLGPWGKRPGLGYGGTCFPRDTLALAAFLDWSGLPSDLPRVFDDLNERVADRLYNQVVDLKPDRIGFLGVAFKAGVPELIGSMALDVADALAGRAVVTVYDPMAPAEAIATRVPDLRVAPTAQACVDAADVVVVALPYREFADLRYEDKAVIDVWGTLPCTPAGSRCYIRFGEGRTDQP